MITSSLVIQAYKKQTMSLTTIVLSEVSSSPDDSRVLPVTANSLGNNGPSAGLSSQGVWHQNVAGGILATICVIALFAVSDLCSMS